MKSVRLNRRMVLVVLLACTLSLGTVAAIGAESSDAAPEAFLNDLPISGTLTGNAAGAFAFYTLDYPGDESVVAIELRYVPADAVTNSGVGFNVYAPDGYLIGQGVPIEDTGGEGLLALLYGDSNEATWLVQVYNYIPDHTISYDIVVKGLPEPEAPVSATPTAVVVAEPETYPTLETLMSGSLVGNGAGSCAFYELSVAEDGPDVSVMMTYAPDDPVITTGVGFVAYGPSGEVARGAGTGIPGERKVTLASDEPGVYLIQVYNYIDGVTIHYTLSSQIVSE